MPKPPPAPHPWLDHIHQGDALAVMEQIPTGTVDLAVTSPPYNLRNSTGRGLVWRHPSGHWPTSRLNRGYECHADAMPLEQYVQWQRDVIARILELLPPEGALFYNHKNRVQNGLLQDRDDIVHGFPVRQIIVWDRGGGMNQNPGYFIPAHELIYLIAKPKFRLSPHGMTKTDVWHISPERGNNPHPAPFPMALARRAIASTDATAVLDPFIGSGTTGLAAVSLHRRYLGIELSAEYCRLAEGRIKDGIVAHDRQQTLPLYP